jgi:N-acetyltransferase
MPAPFAKPVYQRGLAQSRENPCRPRQRFERSYRSHHAEGAAVNEAARANRSTDASMPFDLQPVLTGRLVKLRPLRRDDRAQLHAVAADPLIWEQHPASDRYKPDVFETFFERAMQSGGALIAFDASDGRVIGSSRYNAYDEQRSEVEIGWTFLARSHWGGAFNGEMKRLMLGHAFGFVDNVLFLIGPENRRSQKSVEKIGAVRIGCRLDGEGREALVYRVTASTFSGSI